MKKEHCRIPAFCLAMVAVIGLALFLPAAALAEQGQEPQTEILRYRQQTGKAAHIYTWKMEKQGDKVFITLEEPEATFTNLCAPDGSTLAWTMVAQPDTRLRAERKGKTLHLQGTLKGKTVAKELALGSKPWFQSLSFALSRMVALKRTKSEFWFLRADELELLGMRAELAGKDQVEADGKTIATERVRIKLDNLMAAFWEASYWFREADQVFLRYRGVNGPPGTDETLIDLQYP